jgi:hypothetical protein
MTRYRKPAAPRWRTWTVRLLAIAATAAAGFGLGFWIGS